MLKTTYKFLLIILFFSLKSFAQNPKCQETKINSIINGQKEYDIIKEYDKKGNLLKYQETKYTAEQQVFTQTTEYEFDNNNNAIKTRSLINRKKTVEITKVYNQNGELTEETDSYGKTKISKEANTNNSEKIYLDLTGKQTSKEIKQFNTQGNLLSQTTYNGTNIVVNKITKEYNKNNKIVSTENQDLPAKRTFKTVFEYNNQLAITKENEYINGQLTATKTNEYNKDLLIKTTRLNKNNQVEYELIYEYNTNKNLIKESFFYNKELNSYIEYQYDANNNKTTENHYSPEKLLKRQVLRVFQCLN
jgi:hypothetical protein